MGNIIIRDWNSKKESKGSTKTQKQYKRKEKKPLMGTLVDLAWLRKESVSLNKGQKTSHTEMWRERKE